MRDPRFPSSRPAKKKPRKAKPEPQGNDRYAMPARRYIKDGERRYCAPWCGYDCTLAAFEATKANAEALRVRLSREGERWTMRVWENMGWHYSVASPDGRLSVSPLGTDNRGRVTSWHAFFGELSKGHGGGQWVGRDDTPEGAIRDAVLQAMNWGKCYGFALLGLERWRP